MVDEQSEDLIQEKKTNEKSAIRKQIEEYLGKKYEVALADGRLVRGVMIATDKDANMIFHAAEERWSQNPAKGSRQLGQAMISKKHVKAMYEYVAPPPDVIPILTETKPTPPESLSPTTVQMQEASLADDSSTHDEDPVKPKNAPKKNGPKKQQKKKNKGKKRK